MLECRMKFKVTLLVYCVIFCLSAWGAPLPQTSGKPLDERQLQGLVNGGVDSHRLALLVTNRGIDFKPTQQFLESLQKAGAQDVLIQALKEAERRNRSTVPPATRSASPAAPEKIESPPFAAANADGSGPAQPDGAAKETIESAPASQPETGQHGAVTPAEAIPAETQPDLGQELARAAELEEGQSWSEAEGAYRAALKLEPTNASTHLSLARTLDRQKKWDEAIAEYREAERLSPDDPHAHRGLGLTLAEKQDWDDAIPEYRKALRQSSDDPELNQKLGEALYAKGDLAGSVTAFRIAASLKPSDAHVRNRLGLALCGLGDVDGALAEYREAVALDPEYAEAYNNLGDALLKKGDRRGALEAYRRGFELAPNDSTLGASYQTILKQLNP